MTATLLVLQHIACEPPAAFEDELRDRGLDLITVELDEGEEPTVWRGLASSPAYAHQAFSYRNAYALQFHPEVSLELAREWGGVPAYADSLERTLGPGRLPGFVAEVGASSDAMNPLARSLFGRWLEHAVGVPRRAVG